jgi:hypothetical protein
MKITRKKLENIIKEEIIGLLRESNMLEEEMKPVPPDVLSVFDNIKGQLEDVMDTLAADYGHSWASQALKPAQELIAKTQLQLDTGVWQGEE